MTIELELDSDMIDLLNAEEKRWLENEILVGNRSLILHSNEIGDSIGVVTSVKNLNYV